VGRKPELGQLAAAARKRQNVLVMGKPGIGKTAFLRHYAHLSGNLFWREPNSLRPLLLRLCKRLKIDTRGLVMSELLDAIESKKCQPVLIVLDDLHEASRKAAKTLAELSSAGCIVLVGAAENRLKYNLDWVFEKKLTLPPLSREDAKKLLGKKYTEGIYRESKGFPLALINGGYHPCVHSSRVDLLPVDLVAPLAYLFLSLRYLARIESNSGLFLLFGLLGFMLLSANKMRRVWK